MAGAFTPKQKVKILREVARKTERYYEDISRAKEQQDSERDLARLYGLP